MGFVKFTFPSQPSHAEEREREFEGEISTILS